MYKRTFRLLLASLLLAWGVSGCIISSGGGDDDELDGGIYGPDGGGGGPTPGPGSDADPGSDTDPGGNDSGGVDEEGPDTPECQGTTQELNSDFSSDQTLSGSCFVVTSSISVNEGATLTLEAGTVMQFEENTGLKVNGRLEAKGTSNNPIALTGTRENPGWWNGLTFGSSDSSVNSLEHTIVEYGGGNNSSANLTLQTCCGNNTQISMSNSTLRNGAEYGFSLDGSSSFSSFSSNTITGNQQGAGTIRAKHVDDLDSASSYSGNDNDFIRVTGGSVGSEVTWPTLGVPLRISGNISVGAAGFVTISKGNTLEFEENKGFKANGKLAVSGTEGQKVTFTGSEEERGWWSGITYGSSNSTDNVIEYATIEYGGGEDGANLTATTCCGNTTTFTLRNSTLRESAGYGFTTDGSTVVEAFENNTVTSNAQGAASINATSADALASSNSFSGNDNDYILVDNRIQEDSTWASFETPYRTRNSLTVGGGANLTIAAGATLEFEENQQFRVKGTLTAEGTSDNGITFRGAEETKGFWKALKFQSTDSQDNVLEYVTISDAGKNADANLVFSTCCGNTTSATVDNVTLTNGDSAGISADGSTTLRGCSNITVMNTDSETVVSGNSRSLSEFRSNGPCQQ